MDLHGVLVLDKPAGVTSARALDPLKRVFGRKVRIGHAGTLDPFATGVLLALVGDATRLSAVAMGLPKTYRATVRFGAATDTLDPEGAVTEQADPGAAAPPGLTDAAASFRGDIEQVPPAYSALKVQGRRAYALARAGEEPALEPRTVEVHGIRVADVRWPDVEIEVTSSAGFYVRALARDLGASLGLPAHLAALRRTSIGPFRAEDGCAPGEAGPERLRPTLEIARAAGLVESALPADAARRFAQGNPVPAGACQGTVAVVATTNPPLLVGIGDASDGTLRARTVLAHARRSLEDSS